MVTNSIIRHLLCDSTSLGKYMQRKNVTFADIKVRLLVLAREENRHIPDHYYRLNLDKSLNGIESLSQLLSKGLSNLAAKYLEMRENRIYVQQSMQNRWQELITYIPPLLLQAAYLNEVCPLVDASLENIHKYHRDVLVPNFRFSALPCPYIKQLEHYISQQNGLHDLHMHLNGSTELDIVWQNMLANPEQTQHDFDKANRNRMVKEQLEQELCGGVEQRIDELLKTARKLRSQIFRQLFGQLFCQGQQTKSYYSSISAYHPFKSLFLAYSDEPESWMPLESLMYVMAFRHLYKYNDESLASTLHQYILILGFANRLIVQQKHQNGFEQFQKITLNDLRRNSEQDYLIRFLQLHGNDKRNIRYLEGRFAPKASKIENELLLSSIEDGWQKLVTRLEERAVVDAATPPELKLIAHFIKRKDEHPDLYIRHKKLRSTIWSQAKVLGLMIQNKSPYVKNIVGADAASSEFDTPPEVFAPAFRHLRRKGLQHFTYHAGEDFYHIISGLRAVYETVEFIGLKAGDRIGHGTAMGLSPQLWLDNVGKHIFIKQGEYLDDLVFAYHLIITDGDDCPLKNILPTLESKIQDFYSKIYKRTFPTQIIIEAWLLRRLCPILLFCKSTSEAQKLPVFDYDEYSMCSDGRNIYDDARNSIAFIPLQLYHSNSYKHDYDWIIEISTLDIFNIQMLETLQLMVLKFLHKKEIVIETLPTSNVRIGQHSDFDTYHLWNWVRWAQEGYKIPPIVVGTDDAGIFATNIYNEFANIYCHLTSECKMRHSDALALLERMDKNAHIYKFAADKSYN